MDNIFGSFLNFHTAAFIIGCYILTWLTRRLFETWKPDLKPIKKNRTEVYKTNFARWWNSFILYLIPPVWGVVAGLLLFSHLTWPKGFESLQAVTFFGMVCGWLSGMLYKLFVKALLKKLGVKDEKETKKLVKESEEPKVAGEDKKKREVEDPVTEDED